MGYLDGSTVTVDAILTNKGRQVLAAGGTLNVTKFALSDDEIDYDLWNPNHTLGTNYYGEVIENMPILEALPDETQMMRYKLVTLPKDVVGIPVITVSPAAINIATKNGVAVVTPTTVNLAGGNDTLGYTAILSDSTVATLTSDTGAVATATNATLGVGNYLDDELTSVTTAGSSVTVTGKQFTIKAKPQAGTTIVRALLTIIGNETGGFKTITITVDPTNFNVQDINSSPLVKTKG